MVPLLTIQMLRTSVCVPIGSGLRVVQVNFTHGERASSRLMAVHDHKDWVSDMLAWHGWWEIRSPQEFGIGTPRSEQAMQEEQPLQVARCTKIINPNTDDAKVSPASDEAG